jgi:hypothetical protein
MTVPGINVNSGQRVWPGKRRMWSEVEVTTCPLSLYVAPDGDDGGMVGDAGHPFATLTRALERVPRRKRHAVRIYVAPGAYPKGAIPELVDFGSIEDGGSFVLVGTGDLERLPQCPDTYEIASVIALGTGGVRLELDQTSHLWEDSELNGYFIRRVSDGVTRAIARNGFISGEGSYDFIDMSAPQAPIWHGGDEIEIVRPSAVFEADKIQIVVDVLAPVDSAVAAQVGFENLRFDMSASPWAEPFRVSGRGQYASIHFGCVEVDLNATEAPYGLAVFEMISAGLWHSTFEAEIQALLPGIVDICAAPGPGLSIVDVTGFGGSMIMAYGVEDFGNVAAGYLWFAGARALTTGDLAISNGIFFSGVSVWVAYRIYCSGEGIYIGMGSAVNLGDTYVNASSGGAISVGNGSRLMIGDGVSCDEDDCLFGVDVGDGGMCTVEYACPGLVGSSAAWHTTGDDDTSWPAVGTTIIGGPVLIPGLVT